MDTFQSILQEEKPYLQSQLLSGPAPENAAQSAITLLDRAGRKYLAQELSETQRLVAMAMLQTGKAALPALKAANQVEIWRKEGAALDKPTPWERWLGWIPALVCAALAIWQALGRHWVVAILLGLAALICLLPKALKRPPQAPTLQGIVQVAFDPLWSALDRMALEMDRTMAALPPDTQGEAATQGHPQLPKPLLESIQMLLEAEATADGAYALRALPGLKDTLHQMGVEAYAFAPDRSDWFAFYPSRQGGQTIRPALVRGEELLLRGQATEEAV